MDKVNAALNDLRHAKLELDHAHARTSTLDLSAENIDSLRRLNRVSKAVIKPALELANRILSDANLVGDESVKHAKGRLLPFFNSLPFAVPEEQKLIIRDAEQRSFENAGIDFRYYQDDLSAYLVQAQRI